MSNRAKHTSGGTSWLRQLQERLLLRSNGGAMRTVSQAVDVAAVAARVWDGGRDSGIRPSIGALVREQALRSRATLPPPSMPTAEELDSEHLVARALELEAAGDLETSLGLLVAVSDPLRRPEAMRLAIRIARAMGRRDTAAELEALLAPSSELDA